MTLTIDKMHCFLLSIKQWQNKRRPADDDTLLLYTDFARNLNAFRYLIGVLEVYLSDLLRQNV